MNTLRFLDMMCMPLTLVMPTMFVVMLMLSVVVMV
jgi:hypothetical protein